MAEESVDKFEGLKENRNISSSKATVNEYGVNLVIDEDVKCPKKSKIFYDKETALNRLFIC